MSAIPFLHWLPDALLAAGVDKKRHGGWRSDNFNYTTYDQAMTTTLSAPSPNPARLEPRQDPAEMAKRIIRQQWPMRCHPDPAARRRARNLIQSHVEMLRIWR